mgnify:CR=1 FL=1
MQAHFHAKRALVTGAGKGIGQAVSMALRGAGAEVIALSRDPADLRKLEEQGCMTICLDLTDFVAIERMLEELDPVDFLVNNAGVSFPEPFLETNFGKFQETLAINTSAAFLVSQCVARRQVEAGKRGSIVHVSSQASQVGLADHAAYCASKGALDQIMRVMALELGLHGIRVNCVNPTVTLTPLGRRAWSDPQKRDEMQAKIPLGRFAETDEVVQAILFLLGDDSSMIHGATVPVDGGFLAVR